MSANMIIIYTIGAIFLVAIILLSIGIAIQNSRKKKLANCSLVTIGRVVKIVKHRYDDIGFDGASSEMFHPIFEYSVGDQKYVKESKFGTTSQKYEIGQEVEIYYNPDNGDQYYVAGENTQKKLGIIFTIAGVIVLIVAILGAIVLGINI